MKNVMKRMSVIFLCATVIFSMTSYFGLQPANAQTSYRVKVEITDKASDVGHGYYISYTFNGYQYSSDTAGQRINQMAWEHMTNDQRRETLKIFATRLSERQKQFGYDFSIQMDNWYNDVTGWTEAVNKWHEKIVKENIPEYYNIFKEESTYYADYIRPECENDVGRFIPVKKMYDELTEEYNYACQAYSALCNAWILKYRVSIMSLSGDLISLITDKCLVPNITPSGSGLLSTSIATTCFDYLSSITGIVDKLQGYIVGNRVNASDATAVINDCNELIEHNKAFIDGCLNRAKVLKQDVDSMYSELLAEQNQADVNAEAAEADLIMATMVSEVIPDETIAQEIETLDYKILQHATLEPSEQTSTEWEEWNKTHNDMLAERASYIENTRTSLENQAISLRNEYIGDVKESGKYFTDESRVGSLYSSRPVSPELNNSLSWTLLRTDTGTVGATDNEFSGAKLDAETYIASNKEYLEGCIAYSESARALAKESREAFNGIQSKILALQNAGVSGLYTIESYGTQTDNVMNALTGRSYNGPANSGLLYDLKMAYQTQLTQRAVTRDIENYQTNLQDNSTVRDNWIDYLEDKKTEYKEAVKEYEDAVSDIDEAYDVTEEFADTLPSYIKNQEVAGYLVIRSDSELNNLSGQADINSKAEALTSFENKYYEYENDMYTAERTADFKAIKVKNMQDTFDLLEDNGIKSTDLKSWDDIEDKNEHELSDSAESSISAMKLLWSDFNGRYYSHNQMMDYYVQLCDNEDIYKNSIKSKDIQEFEQIKNQVKSYNMGAHSYTYNIEHNSSLLKSSLFKMPLLHSSGTLAEPDIRTTLVLPMIEEISTARSELGNNIRTADVTLENPAAGARIDTEHAFVNHNYAASNTAGFIIDKVRAVDSSDNFISDSLDAGKQVKFRLYYHVDSANYCIDPSCTFRINGIEAFNGNDRYGEYIETADFITIEDCLEISILEHPKDVCYDPGDDISFTCKAEGGNLSYQWKLVYDTYDPWEDKYYEHEENIAGANSSTYVLHEAPATEDGRRVYCEVSNQNGSVKTNKATMNCNIGIMEQPKEVIYYDYGSDISLSIKIKGQNPHFQWYAAKSGEEFMPVADNNSGTLVIPDADGSYNYSRYYCDITFGDDVITSSYYTCYTNITLKEKFPEKIAVTAGQSISISAETIYPEETYCIWYICDLDSNGKPCNTNELSEKNKLSYYPKEQDLGRYIYCHIYDNEYRSIDTTPAKLISGGPIPIDTMDAYLSETDFTYSGKENKPTVTFVQDLKEGIDYTVSYNNEIINVGPKGRVIITGIGKYTGRLELAFMIRPASINTKTAKISASSYSYTGKAFKPAVTISGLKSGTDFTTTYSNNTKPGTATITIIGTGNYTGSISKTFKITKASISSKTIKLAALSYIYTGKEIKPAVTISGLKSGTDYTIAYSNNTKVGKGKVTITGKGYYTGTVTKSFSITPKKAVLSKLTSGKKKLTVKMNSKPSSKKGSGYEIAYQKKGTSTWKTSTTTSQSKTIKSLTKGKTYYIKVRTYKTVSGTKYYSPWSASKLSKKIK